MAVCKYKDTCEIVKDPCNRLMLFSIVWSRHTMYMLKRQYGGTVDIYRLLSTDTDMKTGVVTATKDMTRIDRAVVLSAKVSREVKQSISMISSNKEMVMGGTHDERTRIFIVDRTDCPDLVLTKDCWLLYNEKKYAIDYFEESEVDSSWVIVGKELVGEVPEQIFLVAADDLLLLDSEAIGGG